MESKSKKLRSGFTTGACAAAAAKAAAMMLLRNYPSPQPSPARCEGVFHPLPSEGEERGEGVVFFQSVEIPFPDGSRVRFNVHHSELRTHDSKLVATASVIKDAGDDPDITNGAEIVASVRSSECGVRSEDSKIIIKGGKGVGTVTKPGLAIPIGEPAINPVPRKMIREAVMEAVEECGVKKPHVIVTISVPQGEKLAKKTLNHRLGIVGGISILGTTGIVRPLSEAAWTATITASFDVAKALGLTEVVLSTGRTSEKAHQRKYGLPVEAYAMMGDYTEFSLRDAAKHGFSKVHLCAQWAKMIKIAMATPQTHVRHGALEAEAARDFLIRLGIGLPKDASYNTSREIFEFITNDTLSFNPSPPNLPLKGRLIDPNSALYAVCAAARSYCVKETGGVPVSIHLVSYEGELVAESE
ncbi:MAG: cobalt-precorrin-5B (C(1))-methyltransferase CbiD [Nitrospirae bacterium]|nr:cobalt-precorrin-5B (C(1))-methyltransferase CbiD [Nitrospirota bacterium]